MTESLAARELLASSASSDPLPPVLPWRLFVCETVTGRIVADLPYVGVPGWSYGINLTGGLTPKIPVNQVGKNELRQLIDFWRFSWGLSWGDLIVQCGPVIDAGYDDRGDNVLSVGVSGIWELWNKKRLLVNASWDKATKPITDVSADVNLADLTLHDIARALIDNDMDRWGSLPIVLPDAEPAGTNERAYPGYDLVPVGTRLGDLTQVQDGPEVEFRPRFTDTAHTHVEWVMRVGSPRLGNLGYPHSWTYGGALVHLSADHDGSRMLTEDWVRGNGMERGLLVGHSADSTLEDAGYPHLDNVNGDHTSATEQSTLDGWATAELNTYGRALTTLTAVVRTNGSDKTGRVTGSPPLTEIAVGDNCVLDIRGHRWLPDGATGQRILQITGAGLGLAQLTLQPIGGGS